MINRAQQVMRSELEAYLIALERRVIQLEQRVQELEARAEDEPEASAKASGFRFRAVR
jgi:hypothetical protein